MGNLRDIIQRITDNLEIAGAQVPQHGVLQRKIETAHQRIAKEMGVPKRYIKGVDATSTFLLPTEAREGGLLYIEIENANDEANVPVPVLTVEEANDRGIRWDTTASALSEYKGDSHLGTVLVIYDPANISAPVYPLGFESGDTLRVLYEMKPTALGNGDDDWADEPFEGILPQYGDDLLVQYVTFEILMAQGAEHARAFFNDYRRLLEEAFGHTRPPYWLPRSSSKEVFL